MELGVLAQRLFTVVRVFEIEVASDNILIRSRLSSMDGVSDTDTGSHSDTLRDVSGVFGSISPRTVSLFSNGDIAFSSLVNLGLSGLHDFEARNTLHAIGVFISAGSGELLVLFDRVHSSTEDLLHVTDLKLSGSVFIGSGNGLSSSSDVRIIKGGLRELRSR